MSNLLLDCRSYETLYETYKKRGVLDIIPIRVGDEFFFWKDERSVLDFFDDWAQPFIYTSYIRPVVVAKQSGMEQMTRVEDNAHPPFIVLYIRLFDEPQSHPVYNQYIGYGIQHTSNVIRSHITKTNP